MRVFTYRQAERKKIERRTGKKSNAGPTKSQQRAGDRAPPATAQQRGSDVWRDRDGWERQGRGEGRAGDR